MSSVRRSLSVVTGVGLAVLLAGAPAFAATKPHPSSLSLRAAKSSVKPKVKDTLTVTMHSAKVLVKGQTVTLEEQAAGSKKFVKVGSGVTNSKGQVTYSVTPGGTSGKKDLYEAFYAGSKEFRASHSNVVTVSIS